MADATIAKLPVQVGLYTCIADLDHELAAKGIMLHVAALPERVASVAKKSDWYQRLFADGRVHERVEEALDATS